MTWIKRSGARTNVAEGELTKPHIRNAGNGLNFCFSVPSDKGSVTVGITHTELTKLLEDWRRFAKHDFNEDI